MTEGLESDRTTFFDGFTRDFFSADGELKVTEEQRQEAIVMCHQSDQKAALGLHGGLRHHGLPRRT